MARDLASGHSSDHPALFEGMVGASPIMSDVFHAIVDAARLADPVLIEGETGTGKELVASAIHARSSRRGPFVDVNCAAVPPTLFESEFLGHERGSFTGAYDRRRGHFEVADGGTLFLDEVGEWPLEMQPKLLRILDGKPFTRLGGHDHICVDVRVVAATNVDVESAVRRGAFREDLYWRLRALRIVVPPVRCRGADILRLIDFLWVRLGAQLNQPASSLSPAARAILAAHSWPGNVREIEHRLRAAIRAARGGSVSPIHLGDLGHAITLSRTTVPPPDDKLLPGENIGSWLAGVTRDAERTALTAALASADGNRSIAARRLGVNRKTLYKMMRRHGITWQF